MQKVIVLPALFFVEFFFSLSLSLRLVLSFSYFFRVFDSHRSQTDERMLFRMVGLNKFHILFISTIKIYVCKRKHPRIVHYAFESVQPSERFWKHQYRPVEEKKTWCQNVSELTDLILSTMFWYECTQWTEQQQTPSSNIILEIRIFPSFAPILHSSHLIPFQIHLTQKLNG